MAIDNDHGILADADTAPHIYQIAFGWRITGILLGIVMIAGSFSEIAYIVAVPAHVARPVFLGIFCIGGVILGAYAIAAAIRSRVILCDDWIEVIGAFKTRRVERKDIGAKMFLSLATPTYSLIPWSKHQQKLLVSLSFQPDQKFKRWMASIPDADPAFLQKRKGS